MYYLSYSKIAHLYVNNVCYGMFSFRNGVQLKQKYAIRTLFNIPFILRKISFNIYSTLY